MIWYTIHQAATRIHRDPETIRRWLREERITSEVNQIDGCRYIAEAELLEAEQLMRHRQQASRFRSRSGKTGTRGAIAS